MKKILWVILFCVCKSVFANSMVVDIFGTEKTKGDAILKEYTKQVVEVESELFEQHKQFNLTGKEDTKKSDGIHAKKAQLAEKIKKRGGFLYVNFSAVYYFDPNTQYTTIEVVEKNNPERLKFLSKNKEIFQSPKHSDIIEKMRKFTILGERVGESMPPDYTPCPVYHCFIKFNHPKLKPYLSVFNQGAIQEKNKILDALTHDPDAERRAAAAFLVGHFKDPKEITSVLLKHVHDQDQSVRNNVIRVLGETLEKSQITLTDVEPFLPLLNSPYATDRNKALSLLVLAPLDKKSKLIITHKAQKELLALLSLKQPNNHGWTHLLLKKISGKNYGEYDLRAWEKWFAAANKV